MEVAQNNAPTASPKRVLYVIPIAWWGGSQHYVFDMACAAKNAGYEVLVATGEGELPQRLTAAGIPVVVKKSFVRGLHAASEFSFLRDTYNLIREFRPDIVHSNNSKGGLVGTVAARCAGVHRILFTAHGWAFTEKRPVWQKMIFWFAHYLTVILTDRTICVSENVFRLGCKMPFVRHKLLVIHNGIPPISFHSREAARQMLAPNVTQKFWVGTIAELHPNKGLDVLIEAFEHFIPNKPDTVLIIIGEGGLRGNLERQIQLEGLQERVILVGHVQDASTYLHALDMFVLPSRTEALGYVLLEAGQAKLPVVASNVGGIPEIIADHSTGLLVPPGNRTALAAALLSLASNEELRTRLAQALQARVETDFSVSTMVTETLSLYQLSN